MSECTPEMISHPESPLSQPSNFDAKETPVIGRDEHYYFIDVIFLVEDSLFKVPRYPFIRASEVFRDMFRLPVSDGTLPDGSSDDKPVVLEGIEKTDFRRLLMVMFPVSPMDAESMSRPEWLSVLKLALLWEMENMQKFAIRQILSLPASSDEWIEMLRMSTLHHVSEIRERAIQHLQSLSSVERILLAKECRVHEWLLRSYRELVERDETISKQDEKQLGPEVTVSLFRLRDQYCRHQLNQRRNSDYSPFRVYPAGRPSSGIVLLPERDWSDAALNEIIGREFQVNLEDGD